MNKSARLVATVVLVVIPTAVFAQPVQQARCTTDSLSPAQAEARLEWARKCGLTLNTAGPNSWFNSTTSFDDSFAPAKEYSEILADPNKAHRAYSGNANNYIVNYQYANSLFPPSPTYTMVLESSAPTQSFYKWLRTTKRSRPLYPSFDSAVTGTGTQLYPNPNLASNPSSWPTVDCNLYKREVGGTYTQWTSNFYVAFYCESSCYTPDQSLRFSDGDVNIVAAMNARRDDVVTLTPDATLDGLAVRTSKVYSYTAEIRDAEHPIVKVTTASGGSLSVTVEHPVLTSEGRLVKAEVLKRGHDLVKADGTLDRIVQVEKSRFFGKVYNMKPMSTDPVANILIAQGFLVGSARFQNDDVGYMNRVLLFRSVPDDVMPK